MFFITYVIHVSLNMFRYFTIFIYLLSLLRPTTMAAVRSLIWGNLCLFLSGWPLSSFPFEAVGGTRRSFSQVCVPCHVTHLDQFFRCFSRFAVTSRAFLMKPQIRRLPLLTASGTWGSIRACICCFLLRSCFRNT